jgi:lysyl-tRNA synthetase, class II
MSELDEQIAQRRRKLAELAAQGVEVYPRRFAHDLEPSGVEDRYGELSTEELERQAIELRVPGRLRALRSHGKTAFLDLGDGRGKVQVMARRGELPAASLEVLDRLDLGDYLGVSGTLIRTRTGELTLAARDLVLLAKALRPLPEKWHGLADVETRYRQRYLDLATNPDSRRVFEVRAALIGALRSFLDERGFLEVETPMMHLIPGGANARPFRTHHNALDLELYLRIAPELFLKRLLVGGLHRVYEINRNFRNEGISTRHNPEFTMLEFYWAYADYEDLIELTGELVVAVATRALGKPALTWQGEEIDLSLPWPRYTMRQAIAELGGVDPGRLDHVADLAAELGRRGLALPAAIDDPGHPVLHAGGAEHYDGSRPIPDGWYGHLLMALFEATVEARLRRPTFITEFPVDVSPLSKQSPADPRFVERFELFIGGLEMANAFSELNDPEVQAARFRAQAAAREGGDPEAHAFDADYVTALEYAMPPAGGLGLGIDRLTMLFTDRASIRDVILFPLLRPLDE